MAVGFTLKLTETFQRLVLEGGPWPDEPISVISFQIVIADQYQGLAELRSTGPLDCEAPADKEEGGAEGERRSFHFQIEAISCSGTYSERSVENVKRQLMPSTLDA